jgi:hypothetical protein
VAGSTLIGLEAFILLALVIGIGVWELYTLRRDKRRDAVRDKPPDDTSLP